MSSSRARLRIEGTVAPGFELVRALYEQNMRTLEERNTQLCVYHRGEKVVDLWASAVEDDAFRADSLVNVFSSGKSLESIALAWLVGKGLLHYGARVADYWPAFAAAGKGELKVVDLMRHEAGLAAFRTSLDAEDLLVENIKQNRVGRVIEPHPQRFPCQGRREYHAVTRGWIVNELFRRVDPAGRTIGEFLREEVSGPIDADVQIGVQEPDIGRISRVVPLGFVFQLLQSLKPKFLGRRIELNIFQIIGRFLRLLPTMLRASVRSAPPPFKKMDRIAYFNDPVVVRGETPSANANASARGLARIAAMMAGGGVWNGTRVIGEAAWKAMHDDAVHADMGFIATDFTQGGVNEYQTLPPGSSRRDRALNTGREGFFGWMGLGGSIFQWNPSREIGFGYVPTSLNVIDLVNERGKAYQAAVLRCIERLDRS